MSHYKPYPEYKESGIEWIGKMPGHWDMKRLRHIANFKNSNVDKKSYDDQESVKLCNYTDVYYNEIITPDMDFMVATASESEIESFSLKKGDVIITKDSEDPKDIGIPSLVLEDLDDVVCGYHLTVINTYEPNMSEFVYRLIQAHSTKAHFFVESPGITRYGLDQDAIGDIPVCVPPEEERLSIINRINWEVNRIDTLITKKTRFIELLKEKRLALITHAVTKGLDPDVPMKDSGIVWIGEIPEHWDMKRLRHIANFKNSNVDKKSYDDQESVKLCNYTDVYYNEIITPDMDFMVATASESEIESFSLKKGDVIITKDSEDPKDIGIPSLVLEDLDDVVCGYHLTVINTYEPNMSEFVYRLIQAHSTKAHFFVESPGITRYGLDQDAIGDIPVCVPPEEERLSIIDRINWEVIRIDTIITKTQRSIELLKERRSAFITAAVTGQIDLREEVQ